MGRVRETLELDHPVADVWGLFVDPDRWLDWNTELAGMRDVRGPFDHPGAGYTQVWRIAGLEREGTWRVTDAEPRRWRRIEGVTPIGLAFRARDEFEPTARGCRVSVEIIWTTPGGRLGRLVDRLVAEPLLRRGLRANADRIAAVLAEP